MTDIYPADKGREEAKGRFIAGEECWSNVGGYRMRYLRLKARRESGAPPLLLVHGLLGYSFSWRHNLEALAEDREVFAIDLLGIGFSDRPPRDRICYSLRASAERLLDWMVEIGLRNADVVGTSHGGGVVMMMAALDRERGTGLIGRLVLVASINPWSRAGLRRTRVLGHPLGAMMFRAIVPIFGIFSVARGLMIERMYGDPRKITQETRDGYDAAIRLKGTVDYSLGVVRHWHRDLGELELVIAAIGEIPALLIWGSKDTAVPVSSSHKLKYKFKNSELLIFDGVGHLPYEESPQEFNRAVKDFLTRQPQVADRNGKSLAAEEDHPS